MTEEKQMILNMLKDGKITVEEASDLLAAIGDKKKSDNDLGGKITSAVDNIIKKATETLSNIDLDNMIDLNNFNIKGEFNTHKDIRIDDEIDNINIDLVNGDIIVEKADDPGIILSYDIYSKKSNLEDYLDVEIKDGKLSISQNEAYKNVQASVNLKLALGKALYENLNIDSVNGKVEVADVDFDNLNIDTVNAKINLINIKSAIDIDNVNGKIDIKNTLGKLSIDNVNGAIYLANLRGELAEVDTVNGNVRVDGLESDKFSADSNQGSIRVYNIKNTKELDLDTRNGAVVVDTTDYPGEIRAFVESPATNVTEKFENKIKTSTGYEISTTNDESDLEIKASTGFGRVSIR